MYHLTTTRTLSLLVVLAIVALAAHLWLGTFAPTPEPVATEPAATTEPDDTANHFFSSYGPFVEVLSELASTTDPAADRAAYEAIPADIAPTPSLEQLRFTPDVLYVALRDRSQFPVLAPLLQYMERDLARITYVTTGTYLEQVPPPSFRVPTVTTATDTPLYTYPPLPVTSALVAAELLALQDPENAARSRAIARDYGYETTALGTHLQSDVRAAEVLAQAYLTSFQASPVYPDWVEALQAAASPLRGRAKDTND